MDDDDTIQALERKALDEVTRRAVLRRSLRELEPLLLRAPVVDCVVAVLVRALLALDPPDRAKAVNRALAEIGQPRRTFPAEPSTT